MELRRFRGGRATVVSESSTVDEPRFPVRSVTGLADAAALSVGDLSRFFNPFLIHFVREELRVGGEVRLSMDGPVANGLLLHNPAEQEASIFTRDPRIAATLFGHAARAAVYSEFRLTPSPEVYLVYRADHRTRTGLHRYAHPVRAAESTDGPAILDLMRDVYGRFDERWLEVYPLEHEACFVVDGAEGIAGAAWATVVNGHGQLHSLSVRARYRRTGVATDLWHARMEWTRRAGAGPVLCEIAEQNLPSRAIAEKGGMRPVGEIYRSPHP
jgi:RimJ/RimL family protein N-acetyltransferase